MMPISGAAVCSLLIFGVFCCQSTTADGVDASRFRLTPAAASCSDDQWRSLKKIHPYDKWTIERLPSASGFTVEIAQWKTTVTSSCFVSELKLSTDQVFTVTNVFPTGSNVTWTYDLANRSDRIDDRNSSVTNDVSPRLIVIGASENFAVYGMCNDVSSQLNIFVTYNNRITEVEQKTINNWIKASKFPLVGPWGAINFKTCHLTKTYMCNGGQSVFCESVKKRTNTHRSMDSSEEFDEGFFTF